MGMDDLVKRLEGLRERVQQASYAIPRDMRHADAEAMMQALLVAEKAIAKACDVAIAAGK